MSKKWLYAGALCLSLSLLLAGCGGKNTSSETETQVPESETTETTEAVSEDMNNLTYAYDYDVEKLVKLGDYKGLPYTITDTSVSDEAVNEEIQNTLNMQAKPEQLTDKVVETGDTVNIDFVGRMDGKEFDGGSSKDYALEIGKGNFIDGFEDGLIDHKPGEEVVLNLKFPDDYSNKDLAGKDAEFTVKINYVEGENIVPELTDEFVAGLGITDVSTIDEYKEYVRNQLTTQNETNAKEARREELIREAVENAEILEYPEDLVKQYKDSFISYYEQYASYYGTTLEEFLAQYGGFFGTNAKTAEDLNQEAEAYGKDSAGNMLVIAAIARQEGIEITDDFYQKKLQEYVEQYGFENAEALENQYGNRYLKQIMMNEEVIEFLEKNAKGVEPKNTPETAETAESGSQAETSAESETQAK